MLYTLGRFGEYVSLCRREHPLDPYILANVNARYQVWLAHSHSSSIKETLVIGVISSI